MWERHLAAIFEHFETDRNAALRQKMRVYKPLLKIVGVAALDSFFFLPLLVTILIKSEITPI